MRNVPNDVVATLCRCLPQILDNLDAAAIRKSNDSVKFEVVQPWLSR